MSKLALNLFLPQALVLAACLLAPVAAAQDAKSRAEGLLIGSLIGDAAGAPLEFVPRSDAGAAALHDLRPFVIPANSREPDPFGPWSRRYAALTDDSRFKVLLLSHLESGPPERERFAEDLIGWYAESDTAGLWLHEFALAASWVLGDSIRGRPPERQWGGIPTMAGQMPFLPLAALTPGEPEKAYLATWRLDFLDNGIARDLNAAVVAGLAAALAPAADWETVRIAMKSTDPYRFAEVPWVPRSVDHWLDEASDIAAEAAGSPRRLYRLLETRLGARTWWEAWVPLVVVFSAAEVADYDPLVTMQLILEFGHDTDSYLQLAGAFFGALHGPEVFPRAMRDAAASSLEAEYGATVPRWLQTLGY